MTIPGGKINDSADKGDHALISVFAGRHDPFPEQ